MLCFFSCAEKNEEDNLTDVQRKINYYVYEYTTEAINNIYSENYIPSELESFLNTVVIKDSLYFSIYELLFINHISKSDFIIYPYIGNYYDIYSDNGLWVDDVLTSLEEIRIGQELEKMENIINSPELNGNEESSAAEVEKLIEQGTSENQLKEKNIEDVENISFREIRDSNNSLVSMEYGNEIFIPQKNGSNLILIHSSGNNVKRFFYDDLFRCYREEHWIIENGAKEENIKTITTEFRGSSYIPLTKKEKSKDIVKNQIFNGDGFLINEKEFAIYNEKQYIKSSLNLKYNNDNKVIESFVTEYNYKDNNYKELDYAFNKKYIYKYNIGDIPPDFVYYENDNLKMKNHYISKGDYIKEIYFADGYSVISSYKDNKLVEEVFTVNGGEKRIKSYEK